MAGNATTRCTWEPDTDDAWRADIERQVAAFAAERRPEPWDGSVMTFTCRRCRHETHLQLGTIGAKLWAGDSNDLLSLLTEADVRAGDRDDPRERITVRCDCRQPHPCRPDDLRCSDEDGGTGFGLPRKGCGQAGTFVAPWARGAYR